MPVPIPISAKRGYLKASTLVGAMVEILDVENIRHEEISEHQVYGSSSTSGFRRRIPGYQDFILSFDILPQGGRFIGAVNWPHNEGDYIKVEGYSDTGIGIKGTFCISRISGIQDIGSGAIIGMSVECGGDGTPGLQSI